MFRSIRPAITRLDIGRTMIEAISTRFVQGFGFSNGWAELGPKKPPPLVPDCLIAIRAATGPRAIVCDTIWVASPSRVVAWAAPRKVIGTPLAIRISATTTQYGRSTKQ